MIFAEGIAVLVIPLIMAVAIVIAVDKADQPRTAREELSDAARATKIARKVWLAIILIVVGFCIAGMIKGLWD